MENIREREQAIESYLRLGSYRAAAREIGCHHSSMERTIRDPRNAATVDRLRRERLGRIFNLAERIAEAALDRLLTEIEEGRLKGRDLAIFAGISIDKRKGLAEELANASAVDQLDYFDPDKIDELRPTLWEGLTEQRRRLLLERQAVTPTLVEQPKEAEPARPIARPADGEPGLYAGLPEAEPEEPAAGVAAPEHATAAPMASDSQERELERLIGGAHGTYLRRDADDLRSIAARDGVTVALTSDVAQRIRRVMRLNGPQ